jgi:hypothetical protein
VEIRKISVQEQPEQKLVNPPMSIKKLDVMVYIHNPNYLEGIDGRITV